MSLDPNEADRLSYEASSAATADVAVSRIHRFFRVAETGNRLHRGASERAGGRADGRRGEQRRAAKTATAIPRSVGRDSRSIERSADDESRLSRETVTGWRSSRYYCIGPGPRRCSTSVCLRRMSPPYTGCGRPAEQIARFPIPSVFPSA